jgi:hypothetical protein
MKPDKIILSHPFSGSLYAFFTEQIAHAVDDNPHHPYYRTLYGKNFRELTDLTLTLTLLYRNIIIAPADNHMPDSEQCYDHKSREYANPELGIYSDWGDRDDVIEDIEEKVQKDLKDGVIQTVLRRVPQMAQRQILIDTRYEMHLASQHQCPVLCSGGRRRIIQRLVELDAAEKQVDFVAGSSIQMVEEYIDISGLMFNPKSLDALYDLRTDKDLRGYADAFVSVMHNFRVEKDVRSRLLLLIRESLDKANLADKISGFFDITSTVLNMVGLIPIVGPAVTVGEIGASGVSSIAKRVQRRQEWYQFGPQVQRLLSLDQIRSTIEEELSRATDEL